MLLGNGDGTFTAAASFTTTGTIAVGDFNGDGKPDLAVADGILGGGTVTILLGKGDGTFTPTNQFAPGNKGTALAVADFNGDGIADLAATCQDCGVTVLLGNGDGTFTVAPELDIAYATYVSVADFNGDGIPDLFLNMQVLLGKGDGTFTPMPATSVQGYPLAIAIGDFNEDGKPDVAVAAGNGTFYGNGTLTILTGNGDGTFTYANAQPTPTWNPGSLALGDFDGDGHVDLAEGNDDVTEGGYLAIPILLGNGKAVFSQIGKPAVNGITSLAVADFNGDGVVDIATSGATEVLTQVTHTTSATASGIAVTGPSGDHRVIAHYDGDADYASSHSSATVLLGQAQVSLSASSLDFGDQFVYRWSDVRTILLTNTGNGILTFQRIALGGDHPRQFLTSNNCGATVAPGASCILRVRLYPWMSGPISAALVLTDSAAGSPQSIPLTGNGIVPPATTVSLSVNSLAFDPQDLQQQTPRKVVTVTNTGAAPLIFDNLVLVGPASQSYLVSRDCPFTVPIGASCTLNLRFRPQLSGPNMATLLIYDNVSGSPQSVTLSGTGLAPQPVLSPASLTFGPQTLDTESNAQSVNLSNTGPGKLVLSRIALTGAHPAQFLTSNNCPAVLAVNAACTLRVRYHPHMQGSITAALTLTTNALQSQQSIQLAASTIDPPTTVSISPASVYLDDNTTTQILTITNTGSATLLVYNSQLTGYGIYYFEILANTCTTAIRPDSSCQITVDNWPAYPGELDGILAITTNTPDSPQLVPLISNIPYPDHY